MKYNGTRLKDYLGMHRGRYTELAQAMLKYRRPRKNAGRDEYNLAPFFRKDHNITLYLLSGLMKETGFPIDFFVDFEPGELTPIVMDGVNGNNNIVNSTITSDLAQKLDHLNEIIRLKDQIISDKERIITLKDAEIEQWKKRYNDLSGLVQAEKKQSRNKNKTI